MSRRPEGGMDGGCAELKCLFDKRGLASKFSEHSGTLTSVKDCWDFFVS